MANIGRPSSYKPEYAEQLVAICEEGWSLTAAAHKIGVNRKTFYDWEKEFPDFSNAMARARAAACTWYEARLRERTDGQGTPKAAIFGVMNLGREDWREADKGPSITIQLSTNLGSDVPLVDATSPRLSYVVGDDASDDDNQ